jgi:ribosomal-protein-alanine N-acetyltransferase
VGFPSEIRTARLHLRLWRDSDVDAFAEMNSDRRVTEYFLAPLSRAESAASAGRIRKHWAEHGFGYWAIELKDVASFIGFAGLSRTTFESPFTPCIEVGWRLAAEHWGRGYATEAAREAVRGGFEDLGLAEIVSFTAASNRRSIRVMERLGMRRSSEFEHPRIPEGHSLRRHVLYRLTALDFGGPSR